MNETIAIVYWSGTGNTEAMAEAVEQGIEELGSTAKLFNVSDFSASDVDTFDAIAFGCPSMGDEELEADEFEPVWEECKGALAGKPVILFGSYDWGDGEWMRLWQDDAEAAGCQVVTTVIANLEPDDDAVAECKRAAAELVIA